MKKILFICLSFWVILPKVNAQMRDTMLTKHNHKVDADLLTQKSKNKKTVAWIMAGGGATLLVTGIIIPRGEIIHDSFFPEYKNDGIKSSFALTGTLSMLGSIPFFISSHHNKKKAASLSLKNDPVLQIHKSSMAYSIPGLSLKFKL